ncbi:MAG: Tn3 family transposase [Moraxellaceae bacterium]|nr:Tn3 family transposase [Moraxellaceae bacterium]
MVKYTTALKSGTAQSKNLSWHVFHGIMFSTRHTELWAELGKAIKTIFLCQYINERLCVRKFMQDSMSFKTGIVPTAFFYGDSSEITSNRQEDQELSVLSLHLLQLCLVYVNTLMMSTSAERACVV